MNDKLKRNELTMQLIASLQAVTTCLHALGSMRLDPSLLLMRDNIEVVRELVENKAMADAIADIRVISQ